MKNKEPLENSASTNLNDDILDELIHNISVSSLQISDQICKNMSDPDKIEYLGRGFSEILSVIICACPKDQIQNVCNKICAFLQATVKHNLVLQELFKDLPTESLVSHFKDKLFIAKKMDGIN